MAEIGNKITDYPISSTISNTDKVFSNVGGALKQVTKETLLAEINSGLSDANVFDMKLDTLYYFRFNEDTTETAMFETYDGSTFKFTLLEICDRNGRVVDSWMSAFSNTNKTTIRPSGTHGQGYYIRFTGGESQKLIVRNITKPNTIGEYVSENRKEIAELKADLNGLKSQTIYNGSNAKKDYNVSFSTNQTSIALCVFGDNSITTVTIIGGKVYGSANDKGLIPSSSNDSLKLSLPAWSACMLLYTDNNFKVS